MGRATVASAMVSSALFRDRATEYLTVPSVVSVAAVKALTETVAVTSPLASSVMRAWMAAAAVSVSVTVSTDTAVLTASSVRRASMAVLAAATFSSSVTNTSAAV